MDTVEAIKIVESEIPKLQEWFCTNKNFYYSDNIFIWSRDNSFYFDVCKMESSVAIIEEFWLHPHPDRRWEKVSYHYCDRKNLMAVLSRFGKEEEEW